MYLSISARSQKFTPLTVSPRGKPLFLEFRHRLLALGRGDGLSHVTASFDPNPLDVHPLGRARHSRPVEPKELFGQVKAAFVYRSDKQFEMVDGACRLSGIPSPSNLNNQAPIRSKYASKLLRKRHEPVDILGRSWIAVGFFKVQGVWGAGDYGIDAAGR